MEQGVVNRIFKVFGLVQEAAFKIFVKSQAASLGAFCTITLEEDCAVIHASGSEEAIKELERRLREEIPANFHIDRVDVEESTEFVHPVFRYVTTSDVVSNGDESLRKAVDALRAGKIGAIKDTGGFHFTFLPDIAEPGRRLRGFKHRETKPFSVMFPDVDSIRQYCEVCPKEEELLRSPAHPIVMLKKILGEDRKPVKDFVWEISGESDCMGAMLPGNPVQMYLTRELGPIVITSGNRGGEPIAFHEKDFLNDLKEGCPDFLLTNDEEILFPLEDSIYQVVEAGVEDSGTVELVQVLRRARGIVPARISLPEPLSQETFAAGGDLQNSFALGKGNNVYLSTLYGDMTKANNTDVRMESVRGMESLYDIHPKRAAAVNYPESVTLKEAVRIFDGEIPRKRNSNVLRIQHHKAHIASVIAEHQLKGPVIGIAFDGNGYGDDGAVWGSDFMLCDLDNELKITYTKVKEKETLHAIPMNDVFNRAEKEKQEITRKGHFIRMGHLRPVRILGGSVSSMNAMQTLICCILDAEDRGLIWEHYSSDEILDPDMHQIYEIALAANDNTHVNASLGRLFDAAAAQLGICRNNTYEGECAERLEDAARRAELKWTSGIYTKDNPLNDRYPLRFILEQKDDEWIADGPRLIGDLRMALDGGVPRDELALEFHDAIAEMAATICEKIAWEAGENGIQVNRVVLSGGVFCDSILLQRVVSLLTKRGFQIYINEKVPCGDGCLALGQMYLTAKKDSYTRGEVK